ncbi:MAG: hypothetical protein WAL56_12315 [Candidatus Sulfotelmatobacter sp.]
MSTTRNAGPDCPISLRPKTTTATKVLIVSALAVIACCLFSISASAQTPLPLGTLNTVGTPSSCSSGSGFYYYVYPNTGIAINMSCQAATVTGCTVNTKAWSVTIGYLNPVGVVPGVTVANGLIVLHGGDGGIAPESFALTDAYFRAGYEVAQVVWADDWEMVYDPFPSPPPPVYGNIQSAACRPATVFNWVYTSLFLQNVFNYNNHAGMCALGDSAGAAAVAYSLAYYNAGSYLDNVELLSGPVLSDISQGCQVPAGGSVNVCGGGVQNCGTPQNPYQCGCQLGTGGSTWTLEPTYLSGANTAVGKWTNDSTCNNTYPTWTSGPSEARWLAQSVVDQAPGGSNGAVPSYSYPNTRMSAWLCRSVQNPNNYNCTANGNNNPNACPNNSSPQGQIYYANFGPNNLPGGSNNTYAVYAVDSCGNAEGVGAGVVPGYQPQLFSNPGAPGITAITDDMVGYAPYQIPAGCVARH